MAKEKEVAKQATLGAGVYDAGTVPYITKEEVQKFAEEMKWTNDELSYKPASDKTKEYAMYQGLKFDENVTQVELSAAIEKRKHQVATKKMVELGQKLGIKCDENSLHVPLYKEINKTLYKNRQVKLDGPVTELTQKRMKQIGIKDQIKECKTERDAQEAVKVREAVPATEKQITYLKQLGIEVPKEPKLVNCSELIREANYNNEVERAKAKHKEMNNPLAREPKDIIKKEQDKDKSKTKSMSK